MNKKIITKEILYYLAGGAVLFSSFFAPGMAKLLPFILNSIKKNKFKEKLHRLEQRKLIKFIQKGNDMFVEITETGRKELVKFDFNNLKINKPKKWDGQWRIVIFDIPESKKKARDALRLKLQELGFYQLQKSVFVFPYDCLKEIDFLKGFFEIDRFITQLKSNYIENDWRLKHFFQLD